MLRQSSQFENAETVMCERCLDWLGRAAAATAGPRVRWGRGGRRRGRAPPACPGWTAGTVFLANPAWMECTAAAASTDCRVSTVRLSNSHNGATPEYSLSLKLALSLQVYRGRRGRLVSQATTAGTGRRGRVGCGVRWGLAGSGGCPGRGAAPGRTGDTGRPASRG